MGKKDDAVNHPSHYNQGKIEVIDFIVDQKLEFREGNAVKYIARAKHKGNEIQDLKKAIWYLQHRVDELKNQSPIVGEIWISRKEVDE